MGAVPRSGSRVGRPDSNHRSFSAAYARSFGVDLQLGSDPDGRSIVRLRAYCDGCCRNSHPVDVNLEFVLAGGGWSIEIERAEDLCGAACWNDWWEEEHDLRS